MSFGYKRLSLQDAKALAISRAAASGGTIKNGQASPLAASTSSNANGGDLSPSAILKCGVENVFPKPDLMIYAIRKDGSKYLLTENVRRREESLPGNRAHSVYLSAQIFDSEVTKKYLEDGYHTYSSNYNYHPSSSLTSYTDQHPFHPKSSSSLSSSKSSFDYNNNHHNSYQSSDGSSSWSSLPPNLSSDNLNHPPYRFECVFTIDVKLPTGNLTKASAITYTPISITDRQDSEFFNFKSSSTSTGHRPYSTSILPICIFILIIQFTVVKLFLSTASFFYSS